MTAIRLAPRRVGRAKERMGMTPSQAAGTVAGLSSDAHRSADLGNDPELRRADGGDRATAMVACLPVLGSVALKVSGPAWLTVALVMCPAARPRPPSAGYPARAGGPR